MKLIAQLKLCPTPEQAAALKHTLEVANAACNHISAVAWDTQQFGKYALQQLTYSAIREAYGLAAQLTIRCLAKVADSYKRDRTTKRTYRPHGGIAYDDRILTYYHTHQSVSIWTTSGRIVVPFQAGERQLALLARQQGETDLVFRTGSFYLLATCEADEPAIVPTSETLGIDLGIVHVATDSDGDMHAGAQIERVRQRYHRRRQRLQAVGTTRARRTLKQLSGRQRRFQTDTNHRIAKQLRPAWKATGTRKAKDTQRALALEDLTHIRQRTTVRKSERARHSNWSFAQLRFFIQYKARLMGVATTLVDPRNTSRMCNHCGYTDTRNRVDQATFCCVACGHHTLADLNAARNIRDRADVMRPMVSALAGERQAAPL